MRPKDIGFSHLSSCGFKGEIYILDFWAAEFDAEFVYVKGGLDNSRCEWH